MLSKPCVLFYLFGILFVPLFVYSQEQPIPDPNTELEIVNSAEVSLENYSDDFQESFFEALKQKGIENYDKAINAFLKCKQLDPANPVVDHELAKMYQESKQYSLAEEYALTAITSQPNNVWYADTIIAILEKQGKSLENLTTELPFDEPEFSENLASIYLKKGNYETALNIINMAKQSSLTIAMSSKIKDSIQKRKSPETMASNDYEIKSEVSSTLQNSTMNANPLEAYKIEIKVLMQADNFSELQELSEEALESYPAQPEFYYAQGYAFRKLGKNEKAIETLEAALDFLLDDSTLANRIYQELANTYADLNNDVKANMYLRKIKP